MSGVCGATYGHNPDACYQPAGHAGTHSNQWGATWADDSHVPSTSEGERA